MVGDKEENYFCLTGLVVLLFIVISFNSIYPLEDGPDRAQRMDFKLTDFTYFVELIDKKIYLKSILLYHVQNFR